MKPILILQNSDIVTAGTILDYFNQNSVTYQVFHSYTNNEFPELQNFDAVINLGCPSAVSEIQEHEFLQKLFAYVSNIVKINKPYLGICFGAQLLAKVLGATVEPNKVKELGSYEITLTDEGKQDSLFKNLSSPFKTFQWHGDTFKIPFGATLLATADDCVNQAFRKNNAVGLQFHLETELDEMHCWCDLSPDDVAKLDKTKETITSSYNQNSQEVRSNNFLVLENFISTIS